MFIHVAFFKLKALFSNFLHFANFLALTNLFHCCNVLKLFTNRYFILILISNNFEKTQTKKNELLIKKIINLYFFTNLADLETPEFVSFVFRRIFLWVLENSFAILYICPWIFFLSSCGWSEILENDLKMVCVGDWFWIGFEGRNIQRLVKGRSSLVNGSRWTRRRMQLVRQWLILFVCSVKFSLSIFIFISFNKTIIKLY